MGVGLSVTVLGCSGSFPGAGGACSGYLVDDGTTRAWVDAGSGTLANLQRHVALDQLDAVVLSHEHPDHWTDLESWKVALRYLLNRTAFPVYAPASLKRRTFADADMDAQLDWHDVTDGDQARVGTLRFTFSRTDHGPETLGMRVDGGGRSLGYSADTGPGWSLQALGAGLDLVLCEATVGVDEEGKMQHLSARQAGASARDAAAHRLVLTHLWPTLDSDRTQGEGSDAFGSPAELASVGARYDV